ncbi:MAG: B12-binding domain-containing radical SAM protein [Polyangiaceae bacterium]
MRSGPKNDDVVRQRLLDETGRIAKEAPFTVALAYPSPYATGMSSLGYQRIYRSIMESSGFACERVFLDDEADGKPLEQTRPLTYESRKPLEAFPVVAVSVAYELEIAGLVAMLDAANIPAFHEERDESHPFVLAGGPLTFSNPLPLGPIVDAIIIGESELLVIEVLRILENEPNRQKQLDQLAKMPHVYVPRIHGDILPPVAKVDDAEIPAFSAIMTPHTILSDMFLIESERGCSRACKYCVMRRSTNGGMRIVPMEVILDRVPKNAKKVGLVGAAVSDHPKITQLVTTLAERGLGVGLSSLRPDRLSDEFVGALKKAGTRTLTTGMDGPSERLREMLERKARIRHLVKCAEMAKKHGMNGLKLYLMVGLPTETDADIDECISFTTELSKIIPVSLGIAPFCAKRNTPLDGEPFAGIELVGQRLDRLKRGLKGRADVRSTSAKWAWVEYILAQGNQTEGRALVAAARAGGKFADYKRAFEAIPREAPKRALKIAAF